LVLAMVVLSGKTSRFHPRHVVLKPTQADEFEMPVRCEWIKPPASFRPACRVFFCYWWWWALLQCSRRLVALFGHAE
jgi:hypothetical protein